MPRLTREQQQQRTREALLAAATEVFLESGFEGASVEQISERAGYTRGAFYSNFSNKEELFLELFRRRCNERIERLQEAVDSQPVGSQKARAAGEQVSELMSSEPRWCLMLFEFLVYVARNPHARPEFAQTFLAFRDAVAEMVDRPIAEAGLELTMPAEDLGTAIVALTHGIALQRLADPTSVPDDLYESTIEILVRGAIAR